METNNKNTSTGSHKYNKKGVLKIVANKRRADRKAKLARILENKTKSDPSIKKYNILVGYDELLVVDVKNILKENNIHPKIITDYYFYMPEASLNDVNNVKKALQGLKFEFKAKDGSVKKVYKIRYFCASKFVEQKKKKKPSGNKTKIVKKVVVLNKWKKANHGINKRTLLRGKHSSGSNLTNYEKKTLARVKKACKYLNKLETKKATVTPKKAKFKGTQKPIQQKLNFNEAA